MVCNSGVGLTPKLEDGRGLQLSAGGLYDGLMLLIDDETRTYWDHITGEAVHGSLTGRRLNRWNVEVTTRGAALERAPDLVVHRSRPSFFVRTMGWAAPKVLRGRGFMPSFFPGTMGPEDPRLPRMANGLGVVHDGRARFYPLEAVPDAGIRENWQGRELLIEIGPKDELPHATWADGERPFQLLTRWYGFSLTYPGCELYAPSLN